MSSVSTVLILFLLMQACSASSESKSEETEAVDTVTESSADTIPRPTPPPVSELAPSQVKVRGHLTSIDNDKIYLKVAEILEYGSSTVPPIAVNDTLAIQAKDKGNQNSGYFQPCSEVVLIIHYNMEADRLQISRWSLIKKSEN